METPYTRRRIEIKMYFEASTKNKNYKIHIIENPKDWKIEIITSEEKKEVYNISKDHYISIDNAISFIFKNSSYVIDVIKNGIHYEVYTQGSYRKITLLNDEALLHESLKSEGGLSNAGGLIAGMPGKIIDVFVKEGDEVNAGDPLLIMEAMKMENEMKAANDVKIKSILVQKGQSVEAGAELITYEQ